MFTLRSIVAPAGVRAFAVSRVAMFKRAQNGYGMFLRTVKGDKTLSKLSIGQRGKVLAKRYWKLTDEERAAFAKKWASKIVNVTPRRSTKPPHVRIRAVSAYGKFVAKNFNKLKNVAPTKRFAALAKLYKKK